MSGATFPVSSVACSEAVPGAVPSQDTEPVVVSAAAGADVSGTVAAGISCPGVTGLRDVSGVAFPVPGTVTESAVAKAVAAGGGVTGAAGDGSCAAGVITLCTGTGSAEGVLCPGAEAGNPAGTAALPSYLCTGAVSATGGTLTFCTVPAGFCPGADLLCPGAVRGVFCPGAAGVKAGCGVPAGCAGA